MISFKETMKLSVQVIQAIEDAGVTEGQDFQVFLRALSVAHAISSGLSMEEYKEADEAALPVFWEIGKMMVGAYETPRHH